jgi:carbon storage regulator
MLVLSRKVGERVRIAGGIVVQVLEVTGRRIRLGVEAPPGVNIWRDELSASREPAATCQGVVRKSR